MADEQGDSDLVRQEARRPAPSLAAEFWDFLKHNKKWWLLPILVVILLLGVLVVISSSGVGAFMYTVF